MKKFLMYLTIALIGFSAISCSKVPITGRKQLKLLPNSMMLSMGESSYREFLTATPPVSPPTAASGSVLNVGQRVSAAVVKYMNDNGLSKKIEGYNWEFNTVDSKEVNAWCMPGGKVVVYSGLLPVTKDDAGLAVVLGHEIAHAIANHGNERMSQQLAIQLGGISLAVAMQKQPEATQNIFLNSFGVATTLGSLAYSRQHELEADKLGLVFMAMAGYNPERAVSFWKDMAASASGNKPPEIMSTHPSDERRIAQVEAFLPEAMKYYTGAPVQSVGPANTAPKAPASGTPAPAQPSKVGVKIK